MYKPKKPKSAIWPKDHARYERRLLHYKIQDTRKNLNKEKKRLETINSKKWWQFWKN